MLIKAGHACTYPSRLAFPQEFPLFHLLCADFAFLKTSAQTFRIYKRISPERRTIARRTSLKREGFAWTANTGSFMVGAVAAKSGDGQSINTASGIHNAHATCTHLFSPAACFSAPPLFGHSSHPYKRELRLRLSFHTISSTLISSTLNNRIPPHRRPTHSGCISSWRRLTTFECHSTLKAMNRVRMKVCLMSVRRI